MSIPDEAVESLARVLAEEDLKRSGVTGYTLNMDDGFMRGCRVSASKYLQAVAPLLQAEAWDEGATAGWQQSGEGWNAEYPDESTGDSSVSLSENPYRFAVPPHATFPSPRHSLHEEGEWFYACEACSGLPDGEGQ